MFGGIYKNRRVLVSGHTGFKGSWLCKWLNNLGAEVYGYSLSPNTEPNHFDLSNPSVDSCINNIIDYNSVKKFMTKSEPEIIFHLAAQPSVLKSYEEPIETFTTNIIGTSNFLEVARYTPSVKAIIIITTDKCYKNKEWVYGYRENDELGGHDPYSASKACAELITDSFRKSFTNKKNNKLLIASARSTCASEFPADAARRNHLIAASVFFLTPFLPSENISANSNWLFGTPASADLLSFTKSSSSEAYEVKPKHIILKVMIRTVNIRLLFIQAKDCAALNGLKFLKLETISSFSL